MPTRIAITGIWAWPGQSLRFGCSIWIVFSWRELRCRFFLIPMLGLLLSTSSNAEHILPPRIEPLVHEGVRYVVPNDKGRRAYVEAWDVQSANKLWSKTIFRRWYCPLLAAECTRYEFMISMVLCDDQLFLTSERNRVYALTLRTKRVQRIRGRPPNNRSDGIRRQLHGLPKKQFG